MNCTILIFLHFEMTKNRNCKNIQNQSKNIQRTESFQHAPKTDFEALKSNYKYQYKLISNY